MYLPNHATPSAPCWIVCSLLNGHWTWLCGSSAIKVSMAVDLVGIDIARVTGIAFISDPVQHKKRCSESAHRR